MPTGYCVKCKEKAVDLSAPEIHQTKKGGFMAKGKHEKCGTTVCAMMSKDNAEKAVEAGAKKAYQAFCVQYYAKETLNKRLFFAIL